MKYDGGNLRTVVGNKIHIKLTLFSVLIILFNTTPKTIHEKFVFGRHERATRVTYCHIISLRRLYDILHDKNTRRYNSVCHKNWTTVFIKIVINGD